MNIAVYISKLLALFMIITYTDIVNYRDEPLKIHGKVKDEATGSNIANAHIYIIKGDEETFSTQQGDFTLLTWQQLPVQCTVEHPGYYSKKLQVADPAKPLVIHLSKK
jgi:hypothetical protein